MFKADDYRLKIKALEDTLAQAKYALDIDNRTEQLKALREEQEKPEVWQDLERSAKIGREISANESKIAAYSACRKALDDANEIIDLIEETKDVPRKCRAGGGTGNFKARCPHVQNEAFLSTRGNPPLRKHSWVE